MNIERMIEATKRISELDKKQKSMQLERASNMKELRSLDSNSREYKELQNRIRNRSVQVVCFGNAINELLIAFRAKPSKPINPTG